MCLLINPTSTHIEAEEDVVCYKFLDAYEIKSEIKSWIARLFGLSATSTKYETPFRNMSVEIGKTYYSQLIPDGHSIDIALHSFVSEKDALSEARSMGGTVIVKCVIPKGSIYFTGTYVDKQAYASNCLKYVEVLTTEKINE